MSNYYCIISGLPDMQLQDSSPARTMLQLKEEMEGQLTRKDQSLMSRYFMRFDCDNLVSLLGGAAGQWDERGNFSREEMEELVAGAAEMDSDQTAFPAFMVDFVCNYEANSSKQGWFARDAIMLAYFNWAAKCQNAFMREWYKLNFNIMNVLTALIARRQGWNLRDYVQGDGEVVEALINQSSQTDFGLTPQLDYMQELMHCASTDDPVEKERQIDALKWVWLEERTFMEPFDINALFSYVVRTEMLERWSLLDAEQGRERFTAIIENLRRGAKVPEEFVRK